MGSEVAQHVWVCAYIHVCVHVCVCVLWASRDLLSGCLCVIIYVRPSWMVCLRQSGVWSSLGWTKLETEKQTFPRNPCSPPTPACLSLLASGAVQPVWNNVMFYSQTGPHTSFKGESEVVMVVGGGGLSRSDSWESRQKKHLKMTGSIADGLIGQTARVENWDREVGVTLGGRLK